jgi:N-acetylglucosaminyldiphosphoundecaprenol N-acetyl-beta-D-mannosaminyltransferase
MDERANVLGVGVNSINLEQTSLKISKFIKDHSKAYICLAPAHNVMACVDDAELRQVFNQSTLTVPDGMGVVWFLRLLGHKQVGRVYGPDLMLAACAAGVDRPWRHFFLGGAPGVGERLAAQLRERFPGLEVAGVHSPPFRSLTGEENETMVRLIEAARPDIIWVGLGSPKQERWMAAFRPVLSAAVLVGVGAAFDFLSGAKPQAPRWIQRIGMEWMFRLLSEPRRLWRRYAQYPRFIWLALGQLSGLKRYSMEENS